MKYFTVTFVYNSGRIDCHRISKKNAEEIKAGSFRNYDCYVDSHKTIEKMNEFIQESKEV
jgi:hypothetical protein